MLVAFLDACVLYPADYRDLLLHLAAAGAFRPLWSPDVQQEWAQNLLRKRPDLTHEQLEHTRNQMNRAFPSACVRGYDDLISEVSGLPDPDDRHVVAAAFVGGADLIVTENVKDFPETALKRFELEALELDAFLMHLVELDVRANGVPKTIVVGLERLRRGLRNPGKSQGELTAKWQRRGLRYFAEFAQAYHRQW